MEEGNETHKPPPAPTARTHATDRAANAPRPRPHWPLETANTSAVGKADRKNASTPAAQPTNTQEPAGTAAAAADNGAGDKPHLREPEKPKQV
ncbi:hypothetical protein LC612_33515 [Nostoc sp. CHAB 5834]|nr:hypothetical protein [Nostoc sp. CHAB 5834]